MEGNNESRSLNDMIEMTINQGNRSNMSRSDRIVSNLEFINDKMDNLRNKINNTNDVNHGNHDVKSSKENNILYSKMNGIVSDYYSKQNELMSKLNQEAKFIKFVGEKYYEMDKKLESEIGRI